MTRPEPGASATARRLAALGFAPVLAPMLRIRRLDPALPPAARVQAVLATSANAVRALPATHAGLPLLAVGDATAHAARQAGFGRVASAAGDAAALADLAAGRLDPRGAALLVLVGRGQGQALCAALRHRGFAVQRRTAYAALPSRRLPRAALAALDAGLHAALFFSAETAGAFVAATPPALAGRLAGTVALAIGAAAASALRPLPWRAVRVAVRPTQEDMLALL